MRAYTVYECEVCHSISKNKRDIIRCEDSHYGLTSDEFKEWNKLKEDVKYKCYIVSVTKNSYTDKDADEAILKLLEFENKHGITK